MSCCNSPRDCSNFDDDREGLSDADMARFGGDDVTCPSCGADVWHDASQCSRCGHAMTDKSLYKGTPAWVPIAGCLVLLGIFLAIM